MLRQEHLPNGYALWVDESCAFGTDALLLAAFAQVKAGERVCDLGTGCGILPLLWQGDKAPARVDGVEREPRAAALACRSVEEAGVGDRVIIHRQSWDELTLPAGTYDRVVSNPPYFAPGSGKVSDDPARRLARHETADTLTGVVSAAARLLKEGGHFVLCHRPQRLTAVMAVLRAYRLEPKRLQFAQARPDKEPFLLLCDAVKGAGESLQVLPPLLLQPQKEWST